MADYTSEPVIGKVVPIDSAGNYAAHAEDAQHVSGDGGYLIFAVRNDPAAALAATNGDYHVLEVDSSGRLWVNVGAGTVTVGSITAGTNVIGKVRLVTATGDEITEDTGNTLQVSVTAGETHIGAVGGHSTRVSATLTRPADTTQYGAGDQVADSTSAPNDIEFAGCARVNAGSGVIVDAVCIDSAAQATKPNLRLYLFSAAPTSNNDNAAWAPSDANMNTLIGYVEFTSWEVGTSTAGAGGNCASFASALNIPFVCGAGVTKLYGLLVERGTYTPVSGEAWVISLGILQD